MPAGILDIVLLSMLSGILNGSGESASRSPRYWGGGTVVTKSLNDLFVGAADDVCCFTISTVVNNPTVFPSFNIFPTRLGILPILLKLTSYTRILISPVIYAPRFKESNFDCPADMYCTVNVNSEG